MHVIGKQEFFSINSQKSVVRLPIVMLSTQANKCGCPKDSVKSRFAFYTKHKLVRGYWLLLILTFHTHSKSDGNCRVYIWNKPTASIYITN